MSVIYTLWSLKGGVRCHASPMTRGSQRESTLCFQIESTITICVQETVLFVDSMSTLFLFHMLSRLTKSASILGCAQGERSVTNSSAVRNSPMAFFARFVSIKSAVTPNPNAKRFETYPEMIILPEAYGKNLVCTSCYASCAGDQGLQTGPGVASGPTHSLHSRD